MLQTQRLLAPFAAAEALGARHLSARGLSALTTNPVLCAATTVVKPVLGDNDPINRAFGRKRERLLLNRNRDRIAVLVESHMDVDSSTDRLLRIEQEAFKHPSPPRMREDRAVEEVGEEHSKPIDDVDHQ